MAKRKRLTPANPDFLGRPAPAGTMPSDAAQPGPASSGPAPETKSAPSPAQPGPSARPGPVPRPPIAQVAGEASAAAALSELTEAMTRARDEGRLIQSLPLAEVETGHLVRDRLVSDEDEMAALVDSLRKRGQQTAIEVVDRGEGARPRYGLISGWRRMTALARLAAEDPRFDQVLALVRAPQGAAEAYVAMVEENEIRVGLSYYERARITVKAEEQGVYASRKAALQTLFANVSRAKRSKIKSFTTLVEALDGVLAFPAAIGERLGLDLARLLAEDPGAGPRLRAALDGAEPASAEDEQALLQRLLAAETAPDPAPAAPGPAADPGPDGGPDGGGSPVPGGDASDAPAPARPAPRIDSAYDPIRKVITLTGPGVSAALRARLDAWLKDNA